MPKYMYIGSYTHAGVSGVIKEGGTRRRAVVEQLVSGLGGKLESFYFGFGQDDFFITVDLPTNVDAATISLMVAASGAVHGRVVALLTPDEIDEATRKTINYRPPGQ